MTLHVRMVSPPDLTELVLSVVHAGARAEVAGSHAPRGIEERSYIAKNEDLGAVPGTEQEQDRGERDARKIEGALFDRAVQGQGERRQRRDDDQEDQLAARA